MPKGLVSLWKEEKARQAAQVQPSPHLTVTPAESLPSPAVSATIASNRLWHLAAHKYATSIQHKDDWKLFCEEVATQAPPASSQVPASQAPPGLSAQGSGGIIPEGPAPFAPEDIHSLVRDVNNAVKPIKNGRSEVVRNCLNDMLSCLSSANTLVRPLTALNPYAALAWGALQYFVQAAVTNRDLYQMCWDVLPRTTYLISRYQTFEALYISASDGVSRTQALLESILTGLYELILDYQVNMVLFLRLRLPRLKAAFGVRHPTVSLRLCGHLSKKRKVTLLDSKPMWIV